VVVHSATIAAGEWITATGEWVNDRNHGQQFKARFLRTSAPTSPEAMEDTGKSKTGRAGRKVVIARADAIGSDRRRVTTRGNNVLVRHRDGAQQARRSNGERPRDMEPGAAPSGRHPKVGARSSRGRIRRQGWFHIAPPPWPFSISNRFKVFRSILRHGFIVAATDYPGLGAAGTHPYLVGVSEARAVIDSVRAARSISGTDGGNRYAAWGHSQGGQAALFSGLIADSYAPELNLVGVAAAAPATNLITLISDDFKSRGGKNLTAMTLWSWSRVFGAPIDRVVELAAVPNVDRLAEQCIESVFDFVIRQRTERPLEQNFLTVRDLAEVESWQLAINLIFASDPDAVDRWHVITTEVVERASADLTARPSPVIGRGWGANGPR
jgi:hypothetical protein